MLVEGLVLKEMMCFCETTSLSEVIYVWIMSSVEERALKKYNEVGSSTSRHVMDMVPERFLRSGLGAMGDIVAYQCLFRIATDSMPHERRESLALDFS